MCDARIIERSMFVLQALAEHQTTIRSQADAFLNWSELMKKSTICFFTAFILSMNTPLMAREHIEIVGSSTVYPFASTVAETYVKKSSNPAPKVEATGSGGGMKMFCTGIGLETPDITNSSRRIKQSELDQCKKNGVSPIELKVGYDGIAIANSLAADAMDLSQKTIFLALAKQIPGSKEGELIANPYSTWQDVDSKLPNIKIKVLGPPPTSGTRDAFVELVMEKGCQQFEWIKALKKKDKEQFKALCHTIREDGAFVEAGENDNLIVQKLEANQEAVGIFGYGFLDQNSDKVQGATINGVELTFENIASGDYPVSRPLYLYIKKEHLDSIKGIAGFLKEFTQEGSWGDDGYLADKGMIPMLEEERAHFKANIKNAKVLKTLTNE